MKATDLNKLLNAFTCKDENRHALTAPYINGAYAYACDGHRLIRMEKTLLGLASTHPNGYLSAIPIDASFPNIDGFFSHVTGWGQTDYSHKAFIQGDILAIAKGKKPVIAAYLNTTVNAWLIQADMAPLVADKHGIDLRLLAPFAGCGVTLQWDALNSFLYFYAMIDDRHPVDGVVMPCRR